MQLSVRKRISLGFGIVLLIMLGAALSNWFLLRDLEGRSKELFAAVAQRKEANELNTQVLGIRVRVNQWLRSMDPKFAGQADTLLADFVPMVQRVAAHAKSTATRDTLAKLLTTTAAYTESWKTIQGLYADEARAYDEGLPSGSAAIQAGLDRARDAERGNWPAMLVLADAGQSVAAASEYAIRYRFHPDVANAGQVTAAMMAMRSQLRRAAAAAQAPGTPAILQRIESDCGVWDVVFAQAVTIAATRAARLVTWTRDEGEPMARYVEAVREQGIERTRLVQAQASDAMAQGRSTLLVISACGLLTGIVSSWVMSRSITRPLSRIAAALRMLSSGDRTVAIPETGRRDEIGDMAKSAEIFKDNAIAAERMAAEQEALKAQAAQAQRTTMHQTADAFEARVGSLVSMLSAGATQLQATAQSMSATAMGTNRQATSVASAAEAASGGVQTVAAAAEELTASIQEIGRRVAQSARITERAVEDARRTDTTVRALSEGAQKIGDVVRLITGIAAQTNLLALNATIEAARAGDAGKGFAVVANEVKSLANQTAKATEEIGTQITQIQSATGEAVQAIRLIGTTIDEVSGIAAEIAAAVEQQGAATAEIARNVQQTASSTQEVTTTIAAVSQDARQTGTASAQVLDAATGLSQQADQLTSEVHQFLAGIRAA